MSSNTNYVYFDGVDWKPIIPPQKYELVIEGLRDEQHMLLLRIILAAVEMCGGTMAGGFSPDGDAEEDREKSEARVAILAAARQYLTSLNVIQIQVGAFVRGKSVAGLIEELDRWIKEVEDDED